MPVAPYTGPVAEFPSNSRIAPLLEGESPRAARVVVTDTNGDYFGWQLTVEAAAQFGITDPDRVVLAGLRTPSATKQAEMDAAATNTLNVQNKLTAARNIVRNQVTRVKAIAPASRTDQDKWLLALTLLVMSED